MFDWVDKHKRWIQLGLLILIVPSFAFFGINYYFDQGGDRAAVAKVAGTSISPQEFENALRERQDQLRQMMKDKADPSVLDSNEVRNAVINGLVEKRALLSHALHSGMVVPDPQVQKIIAEIPYFKDDATGKFSAQRYAQVLKSQGMTPVMFEERVRQDLRVSQSRDSVSGSTVVPDAVVARLGRIREQRRELSAFVLSPDQYLSKVSATDEEAKKFYDANQKDFRIPERVRVEYVTLSADTVAKSVVVPNEEIEEFYRKNEAQYRTNEERRASHILIATPKDATAAVKADARNRAEQLLADIRKAPGTFADAAKKNSQDPGSAASGGDLGFFSRGAMAKSFDEAVFAMAVGELRGPIETPYGFHIIRLDEIKAGQVTPLDKVRGDIAAEIRKPRLAKAFSDAAETFSDAVFSQSDSLKPVADSLKLEMKTSDWITRDGGGDPQLTKPELLGKIFSEESIKQKRNTPAVEVAPNTLIAARVVDHRPANVLPFEDVKSDVIQKLQMDKATRVAQDEGKALLEGLRKGQSRELAWGAPFEVSLQAPGQLQVEAARDVFSVPSSSLPAYVGAAIAKGRYVVYRVSRITDAPAMTAAQKEDLRKQLRELAAQQQFDAYLQAVKAMAEVSVDTTKVEKKGSP